MTVAIAILLIIGVFFAFIGVLGILRMPDVFGRLQASTCIATLSTLCVNIAGILYIIQNGLSAGSAVKLGLLALFVLGTNPVSNHALCRAAYRCGERLLRIGFCMILLLIYLLPVAACVIGKLLV